MIYKKNQLKTFNSLEEIYQANGSKLPFCFLDPRHYSPNNPLEVHSGQIVVERIDNGRKWKTLSGDAYYLEDFSKGLIWVKSTSYSLCYCSFSDVLLNFRKCYCGD